MQSLHQGGSHNSQYNVVEQNLDTKGQQTMLAGTRVYGTARPHWLMAPSSTDAKISIFKTIGIGAF